MYVFFPENKFLGINFHLKYFFDSNGRKNRHESYIYDAIKAQDFSLVKDSNFQKQRKTVRGSQKVRLALFCK